MSRYFLTRLQLEGFRGVNNEGTPLDLKFRKDTVNSIFAVNGIGKSSIFEALYYCIFGIIPKLDALQTQERPQDYYCNRFHSQNEATIELEFSPDDGGNNIAITVHRDSDGRRVVSSSSGHPDPEAFLASLREAFTLLDYRTFGRFIEESPLERGRTFSTLLGLAEYSDRRQALQVASDTRSLNSDLNIRVLEADINSVEQTSSQALTTIRTSYEQVTGQSFEDITKLDIYSNEVLQALQGIEMLKNHVGDQELESLDFDETKEIIKQAEGGEKRKQLSDVVESLAILSDLEKFDLEELKSDQDTIAALIKSRAELLNATRGDLFKKLYQTAETIIQDEHWTDDTQCPLCETQDIDSISTHVSNQLEQYKEAASRALEIKELWAKSVWKECLVAYEEAKPLSVEPQNRCFPRFDSILSSGDVSEEQFSELLSKTSELLDKAVKLKESFIETKQGLESELPASLVQLTEQVEYAKQFRNTLLIFYEKQKMREELNSKLGVRKRWQTFISEASSLFSSAEARLSKARIDDIDDEYKSMFKDIMQVGDVVPDLRRANEREDLHVQLGEFHGQSDVSARALLSESYRNALAISVFLAAAQKHAGAPRFIVLDDVTSSFDAGHQFCLMELIRTKLQFPQNPEGLQFILLSHDGLLEKYFDRHGNTSGWSHTKLQGSPPMGTILNNAQGADRLRTNIMNFLAAGQTSQAEPLIRQYLEYKLQQIIRRVGIPVPIDFAIKDSNKMVQNCLDAINAAVALHEQAGNLILEDNQKRDLSGVHVPAILGNWLSHFETGSTSSLSAPVLSSVVNSIDSLAECFKYDDSSGSTTDRKWYRSLSSR